jgi:hypothetical protein
MGIPAVNVALIPFARKNEYNRALPISDAAGQFAGDIVGTLRALGTNDTNIGILASVAVPGAKWLSAAIGGGLVGAALTDSCLMGTLLAKLPYNKDASCDLQTVLRELSD